MKNHNFTLLPAANLTSPSKKSQLKTPPHSTIRISSLTSTDGKPSDFSIDSSFHEGLFNDNHILNGTHRSTGSGLLSPEFSSPNFYETNERKDDDDNDDEDDDADDADKNNNNNANNDHESYDINHHDEGYNIFQVPNININIISDSPVQDSTSDKENNLTSQPLMAPNFTKKRPNPDNDDNTNNNNNNTNKKSKIMRTPVNFILPEPDEMPEISFNSTAKPPYSYASLIGMALLRAPNRRLTLAEIYQWISDNFKYYKKGEVGWQNSIRHNLSLNKAFEKTEKSKERKGHFWQIVSGFEHVYCNIKESKRGGNLTTNTEMFNSQSKSNNASSTLNVDIENDNDKNDNNNNDDGDDDNDNDNDNDNDDINNNTTQNDNIATLNTPRSNLQDGNNFFYKSSNHNYSHSRNPSNNMGSIPELNLQYSSYTGSLNFSPIHLSYGLSPGTAVSIGSSSLDFTSSFSSRSNFELSPSKPIEPGPLLEPLTPNKTLKNIQLPSISKQLQTFQPLGQTQFQNKLLSDLQFSGSSSIKLKTPLKLTNTPINNSSSSVARKLWASPSYLDDFYASPIYSNKDATVNTSINSLTKHHASLTHSIYGSPLPSNKRRFVSKNGLNTTTNGYSTNEIFGIDICTIHNNYDESDR